METRQINPGSVPTQTFEWGAFYTGVQAKKRAPIHDIGMSSELFDPDNTSSTHFNSDTGKIWSRWNNPEFNKLFDQMATMENGPERLELVHKMNDLVAEECPVIFNFHRAFYTVVQPWTPRTVNNEMLEVGMKYAQVIPEIREQKRREWNRKPLWPIALLAAGFVGLVGYGVRWSRRQNA